MRTLRFMAFFILSGLLCKAQQNVPVDTSFTLNSAYFKEIKNYPFISLAQPVPAKGITFKPNLVYTTIGKRALHADVWFPAKSIKNGYPVVVLLHGGGWRSGNKLMAAPMAIGLAAHGFVTIAVEYRLSPEAQYPAGISDIRAALQWLRKNAAAFHLNKNKVAVLGTSSGGQMAALLGTTNNPKSTPAVQANSPSAQVQAVIDIDGILAFKHPESAEGKVAGEWLGGTYEQKPGVWDEASALNHVDSNSVPILFINSSLPRFHAGRDDMIKKLADLNIYFDVHTLPDTPHTFWLFHPWFTTVVDFVVHFLNKIFK